jgi:hypothetical protein
MELFQTKDIFSNSSHLEWRAGLSGTFLKGIHPGTIPARFGVIWFTGFSLQSHIVPQCSDIKAEFA